MTESCTENSELCPHGRMIGTFVCLDCPSGTAEEDLHDGLCKSEPEIQCYLKRLNINAERVHPAAEMDRADIEAHGAVFWHSKCDRLVDELGNAMRLNREQAKAIAVKDEIIDDYEKISQEYHAFLQKMSDLFGGKTGGRCVSDDSEEVEGG